MNKRPPPPCILALLKTHLFVSLPVFLFSIFFANTTLTHSAPKDLREYKIKAAFIYNFTKFIKWPESAGMPLDKDGLTFCVAGEDPFGETLAPLEQKFRLKNKNFFVKRSVSFDEMPHCHILFVGRSEKNRLKRIIERVKGFPVLLLGDTPGFVQRGVIINFLIQNNNVGFEINLDAGKRSNFKFSSRLLKIAKLVISEDSK